MTHTFITKQPINQSKKKKEYLGTLNSVGETAATPCFWAPSMEEQKTLLLKSKEEENPDPFEVIDEEILLLNLVGTEGENNPYALAIGEERKNAD